MSETATAAPEFDAVGLARTLLRTVRAGSLATIDRETGGPFASLVSLATDIDGAPLLLVSALSGHTGNLDADPRASILFAQGGKGDPLAHPRLSVVGRVEVTEAPQAKRRFLARHPKAALYADFPDFSVRRLLIETAHLNGGFARAARLAGRDILSELSDAEALVASEGSAVAHMNTDHAEALGLYATRLLGRPGGPWRVTGLDPDGMDLAAGDMTARLDFPERVTDSGALRRLLVALADRARAAGEASAGGPA